MILQIQHFTKQCTKCKEIKIFDMFFKSKATKTGLHAQCKECALIYKNANKERMAEYKRNYQQENKKILSEIRKARYEKNKENVLESQKIYYINNKEKFSNRNKEYRQKNDEILKEKSMNYRNNNKESIAKTNSEYYQNNKRIVSFRQKEYYEKNKDIINIKHKDYAIKNKDKLDEYRKIYRKTPMGVASSKNKQHKRRAHKKQGDIKTKELLKLQQNAKVCYWCNESLKGRVVHVDHYDPISKGGLHTLSNLVVTCQSCNNKKHAKDPLIFANSIGKLL